MLGDERLELADELGMAAELEVGVDARLERGEALFLQAAGLGTGERRVGGVGERGAAPEREGVHEGLRGRGGVRGARLKDESAEALEVELARLHPQLVARTARLHPSRPEQSAQAVHRHLEGVRRRLGCAFPPEAIDEPLARDELVPVQQQEGEQGALPGAAEGHGAPAARHLERAENPELEPCVSARQTSAVPSVSPS